VIFAAEPIGKTICSFLLAKHLIKHRKFFLTFGYLIQSIGMLIYAFLFDFSNKYVIITLAILLRLLNGVVNYYSNKKII
jgi:hypothetical protein